MAFVKKLFEDLDFTQPRPISRLFLNDPVDFGVSEADVPGMIKIDKLSKFEPFFEVSCFVFKGRKSNYSRD